MQSEGYLKGLFILLAILLIVPGMTMVPSSVTGTPAEVIAHRLDPQEPSVDSVLNVTVEFNIYDEPLTLITIQWCIVEAGGGGACGPMEDMSVDITGRNYSIEYPVGTFQNATYEFHVYDNFVPIYDFETHVARNPTALMINSSMEPSTIHPNETITVSGDIMTDLGEYVEGAALNLSIGDLQIFSLSTTDEQGLFSVDLSVPMSGYYIVNLTSTWQGLHGYADYPLTVSEWTLPNVAIKGVGFEFNEMDAPPGADIGTFYQGSNVTFEFEVKNSGTAEARNVSIHVDLDNGTSMQTIDDSSLLPGQRFPGALTLNTSEIGEHSVELEVEWEQTAPYPDGFSPPKLTVMYEILLRPEWTGHTVFVEMFTQKTCAPCVYVEEALEVLHVEGVNFEYVVYAIEDTESGLIAENKNIQTTPVLFVDGELFRKDGSSNDLGTEIEEISDLIEDAASLERAPVHLEFSEGDPLDLSVHLDPEYRQQVSGILKIYRVEPHPRIRNNQSIPMSNRYMGSVPGTEVDDLQPGGWVNLSLDTPEPGGSYIAVFEDDDGNVLGSIMMEPGTAPEAYVAREQTVMRIPSPGSGSFGLVVDRFQFQEGDFGVIDLSVSSDDIPAGWTVTMGGEIISSGDTTLQFEFGSSSKEIKPAGRIRYLVEYDVEVAIPVNISGNFELTLDIDIGLEDYHVVIVVIVPEPEEPEIEIVDIYLEGAGKTIYFYVEAKNVPENGNVKGTVLPCNYGPGALCGLPEDYLLNHYQGDLYRTALVGVDLKTYTHLTYSAWVEVDGMVQVETEEEQVEISTLIDVGAIDDDDEDGMSPWIPIFSVLALLVILVIGVVIFLMARRAKEEETVEEIMGESAEGSPEISEPQEGVEGSALSGEEKEKAGQEEEQEAAASTDENKEE